MLETVTTIASAHLNHERSVWVLAPSRPAAAQHLAIFLDGEFYRERIGAAAMLENLRADLAESWFVFVSMGTVESRWVECPCHPPFARFIVDELLPHLHSAYPAIQSVHKRTMIGLSYTGLAASYVAREYPGVFHNIISQSGSYWSDNGWLTEQFRTRPPVPTAFYLEVGTREVQENVQHRPGVLQVISQIEGVRRFRDTLLSRGHRVEYSEFEGAHEFSAWKRTLPAALRWALPADKSTASSAGERL